MRDYLSTIPSTHPPPPPPPEASPEQLHAIIISLRTHLDESRTALQHTKDSHLDTRKRAARAEGRVNELDRQMEEARSVYERAIGDARERMTDMERGYEHEREKGEGERMEELKVIERERVGLGGVKRERDDARTELGYLKERIEALKADLDAAKRGFQLETKRFEGEREVEGEKVKLLESELQMFRDARREMEEMGSRQVGEVTATMERLQGEAIKLKSELQWRTSEAVKLQRRADEAETAWKATKTELDEARERLGTVATLEQEVKLLRDHTRDKENVSSHLAALTSEKAELSKLIARLSPTGDVQEGLTILYGHAQGRPLAAPGPAKRLPFGVRHEDTIEEIKRERDTEVTRLTNDMRMYKERSKKLESDAREAVRKMDSATKTSKQTERSRRILLRENDYLKKALGDMENAVDKEDDMKETDGEGHGPVDNVLRQLLTDSQKANEEYKTLIKELETNLERVGSEPAESSEKTNVEMAIVDGDVNMEDLQKQLVDATRAAEEESKARNNAEQRAKAVNSRLVEVETELHTLKLDKVVAPTPSPPVDDCPPDFDPKSTKVIHFMNNPLEIGFKTHVEAKEQAKGKKRLRSELESDVRPALVSTKEESGRIAVLEAELAKLTELNKELDKLSKVGQRTKLVAKKRIEEVRLAVYNIFGWTMNVKNAKFIMSSMYAEGPCEELQFGLNEKGSFSLHETEYANRLNDEIDQYVRNMKSYPALLAHITMENFNKTTAM